METFVHNISQVLGITLLHSLWQGLLIYAVIRLGFIAFPAASAANKYKALYCALVVMSVWFAYTFFTEAKAYNWTTSVEHHLTLTDEITLPKATAAKLTQSVQQPFYYQYKHFLHAYLPYISALYLISVLVNLARLTMGWQNIRRIKKNAGGAAKWQRVAAELSNRTGIVKHVQVSLSNLVDVPCAFGYLKPVILLPVSISTQLSAEEIEVIILHELAHIKNNDYILNLIQQILALLLFLNPFAQLISRMIDVERENRCDDTVVQVGDPLTYAGALVKLEKNRQQNLQLALAATGKKYHLFDRVKRIMSNDKPVVNIKHLVFGLLIFMSALGSIAWLNPEIKDGKLTSKKVEAAAHEVAEMVKAIAAPDTHIKISSTPVPEAAAVGNVMDSTTNTFAADSGSFKKDERTEMLTELERLSRELDDDEDKLNKIQAYHDWNNTIKAMEAIKTKDDDLTPEVLQRRIEDNRIRQAYLTSASYLNIIGKHKKFQAAYKEAVQQRPEIVAFEETYNRQRDSVRSRLMQVGSLTAEQLENNAEWNKWLREAASRRKIIEVKLLGVPPIKALNDSVNATWHALYQSPEFKEFNNKTRATQAEIEFMDKVLEPYRVKTRKALAELKATPVWLKKNEDSKRYDELVKKLAK